MANITEQFRQLQEFKDYCEGVTAQDIHLMLRTKLRV